VASPSCSVLLDRSDVLLTKWLIAFYSPDRVGFEVCYDTGLHSTRKEVICIHRYMSLIPVVFVLMLLGPVHHHKEHHRPGCNTHACDVRIDNAKARRERLRMHSATASYYNDAGGHACSIHATYGFAHLGPGEDAEGWIPPKGGMACGTRIRPCAARCVTATMDDHGPYIYGREFDLNETLKNAIGAGDLGKVRWRYAH